MPIRTNRGRAAAVPQAVGLAVAFPRHLSSR